MKFKHDVMFTVQVSVDGRQQYTINTTDYDYLCDKLTDVYINETK
jgi:hypothetical protein|tara:strand:+ start:388 stop:522 length:135 start_codon:yes stop_codon:yes gene_type:complete